jgi:hypothetical protein
MVRRNRVTLEFWVTFESIAVFGNNWEFYGAIHLTLAFVKRKTRSVPSLGVRRGVS